MVARSRADLQSSFAIKLRQTRPIAATQCPSNPIQGLLTPFSAAGGSVERALIIDAADESKIRQEFSRPRHPPAKDVSQPAQLPASQRAKARLPTFYAAIDFEVSTCGALRQNHFQ